jgi:O-6-methylguanine DNA methyltransferase
MTGARCSVTENEIAAWVCGDVEEPRQTEIAVHLGTCRGCCEQATEYVGVKEVLESLDDEDVLRWHRFGTPFGTMYAASTERGLSRVSWSQPGVRAFEEQLEQRFPGVPVIHDRDALEPVERQIVEYFEGERTGFDLDVDLRSVSDFDRRVLDVTARIPYGEVLPYAEVARRIGRPRASRAVGGALGRNPVAIVVPCHRVIRTDGSLGGYGGGVQYKKRLLGIEGQGALFGS